MKIRKLLSVAVMAALCGNAWAQTDVTSTYLTNPSFELKAEGTAAIAEGLTNNGTYYGWQLPNLGTSFVNISIGNSTPDFITFLRHHIANIENQAVMSLCRVMQGGARCRDTSNLSKNKL